MKCSILFDLEFEEGSVCKLLTEHFIGHHDIKI